MADNLQFPIQPVPSPEKTVPFQVPEVPDASGIIMQAAHLQQQKEVLKQKKVEDLVKTMEAVASLAVRKEELTSREKMAEVMLKFKDESNKRANEKFTFLKDVFGAKPFPQEPKLQESLRELNGVKLRVNAFQDSFNNLKQNPSMVDKAIGMNIGTMGRLTLAQLAPRLSSVVDPDIKVLNDNLNAAIPFVTRWFNLEVGNLSESDQKLGRANLPSQTDTFNTAQSKLGTMINIMSRREKLIQESLSKITTSKARVVGAISGDTGTGLSKEEFDELINLTGE